MAAAGAQRGGDLVKTGQAEQVERQGAEQAHHSWFVTGVDQTGIFAEDGIQAPRQPVLDRPVAPFTAQAHVGIGPVGWQTRDRIVHAALADAVFAPRSFDPQHLGEMRPLEIARQVGARRQRSPPSLPPNHQLCGRARMSWRGVFPLLTLLLGPV